MNERIRNLLEQIQALEEQLLDAVEEQETKLNYRIEGARVRFDEAVREAHRKLKTGIFRWLRASRLRNVASAPFIYGMIVPFVILDITLSLYQAICFRLYDIPRVQRGRYIVIDRHRLAYLNSLEKLNCVYCSYANGLIAYGREITARTEQYWCPIKHARKVAGTHSHYVHFIDYGDADNFRGKFEEARARLKKP